MKVCRFFKISVIKFARPAQEKRDEANYAALLTAGVMLVIFTSRKVYDFLKDVQMSR